MIEEKNNFARDKKNIIEEKLNMEKVKCFVIIYFIIFLIFFSFF